MPQISQKAPELIVEKWLNTDNNLSLKSLRGKVVAIFAFQMLCPGCVEHSIPQAKKLQALFSEGDVQVIGLHTVFEHHAAMAETSLKAFLHEYGVSFPVAIDVASTTTGDPLPKTMRLYGMRGTPSLLLIDKSGKLRKHKFGREHDMAIGAEVMMLMNENAVIETEAKQELSLLDTTEATNGSCTDSECTI